MSLLLKLPLELWIELLSWLPLADRQRFLWLNKTVRGKVKENSCQIYAELDFSKYAKRLTSQQLLIALNDLAPVHLDLSGCFRIFPSVLLKVNVSRLLSFKCDQYVYSGDTIHDTLREFNKTVINNNGLNLANGGILGLFLQKAVYIKELQLSGQRLALKDDLSCLENLKSLVCNNINLDKQQLHNFIASQGAKLRRLNLLGTTLDPFTQLFLTHYCSSGLKHLGVDVGSSSWYIQTDSARWVEFIRAMKCVEYWLLRQIPTYVFPFFLQALSNNADNIYGLELRGRLSVFRGNHSRFVRLEPLLPFTPSSLQALSALTKLRILKLSCCRIFTDDELCEGFCDLVKQLQVLHIRCPLEDCLPSSLLESKWAVGWVLLKELHIFDAVWLNQHYLYQLEKHCPKLTMVILEYCDMHDLEVRNWPFQLSILQGPDYTCNR